ncbi:sugar transferase, partial [Candidatus Gracilibacteria bacterium]|nr:sugar transferase [Candidatus Gracilibacteria bacterium]
LSLVEHNFTAENIQGLLMLNLQKTPLTGWGRINKRLFDFSISLVALSILAPFFLIIAAAIKLESKGTVFFRYLDDGKVATRIGQSGKHFYCYKFRSMKANTHNHRYQELSDQNQRSGPIVKIKNDPRITKIGKLLRRFDFDELPQLINVLIGNMSLVGPRPHLPEEVSKYDENARFVLTIKPGITGMAQVSGRSSLNFDDEIKLDTYYIEHWSLLLDIKILLKTIPAVIFKKAD